MAPAFEGAEADAFSALSGAEQAVRAGYAFRSWTFSVEQGSGAKGMQDRFEQVRTRFAQTSASSGYSRLLANFRSRYLSTTVGLGQLREDGGPLGAFAPPGSDLAMPASSRFVSIRTRWEAADGLAVIAEGAFGRTAAEGRLMSLRDGASSSWSLQATADCALLRLACAGISVALSQPLRIERGTINALLPDQPSDYFDDLTYSWRELALRPSGRELDLRLSGWSPLGIGALHVEAAAILQEGHRRDAPLNLGVAAGWRASF